MSWLSSTAWATITAWQARPIGIATAPAAALQAQEAALRTRLGSAHLERQALQRLPPERRLVGKVREHLDARVAQGVQRNRLVVRHPASIAG